MGYFGWKPYVPVAQRRAKAMREMEKLRKKGHPVSPVELDGRTIARTFWGKAWCDNLERYSDFENRLPRGRTYVRNGSVVDLQIAPGEVTAMVSGSEIYRVNVKIAPVAKKLFKALCSDCAGAIDSLVELLQGRFSKGVMERVCMEDTGLFPTPREIEFSCSCPDWAYMCKHVAAVLYGIGARLDLQPELLFALRQVDEKELIAKAGEGLALPATAPAAEKVLADEGLSELFGVDLAEAAPETTVKKPSKKAAKPRRVATTPKKVRQTAVKPALKPAHGRKKMAEKPTEKSATSRGKAPVLRKGLKDKERQGFGEKAGMKAEKKKRPAPVAKTKKRIKRKTNAEKSSFNSADSGRKKRQA